MGRRSPNTPNGIVLVFTLLTLGLAPSLLSSVAQAQEPPPGTFTPNPPTSGEMPGMNGAPPPQPPMPQRDEPPPQQNFSGGANPSGEKGTFGTPNAKKLRLMKRVSGPECTPEQWQAGSWFKGSHEHNFGWWWIANGTWYSYTKAKSPIPNYDERSIIVYADDKKYGSPNTTVVANTPAAHKTISLFGGSQSTSLSSTAAPVAKPPAQQPANLPIITAPATAPASVPANSPGPASVWTPPKPPGPAQVWTPPKPPVSNSDH